MRYAIEKNGETLNVILTDSSAVAAALAARLGAISRLLADGEHPTVQTLTAAPRYVITRFEFMKRIGRQNRKDIRASVDPNVVDGWELIRSADLIDVRDDAVIEAVDSWRAANIINMARRNAILAPA